MSKPRPVWGSVCAIAAWEIPRMQAIANTPHLSHFKLLEWSIMEAVPRSVRCKTNGDQAQAIDRGTNGSHARVIAAEGREEEADSQHAHGRCEPAGVVGQAGARRANMRWKQFRKEQRHPAEEERRDESLGEHNRMKRSLERGSSQEHQNRQRT